MIIAQRIPLPNRRRCWTQKVRIGGQTIYMTVGEYPDGSPGEVFLDAAKQGTMTRAMLNALAIFLSLGLQHGVSLELYLNAIKGLDFEPSGPVEGSLAVTNANSILDYICKELEAAYIRQEKPAAHDL